MSYNNYEKSIFNRKLTDFFTNIGKLRLAKKHKQKTKTGQPQQLKKSLSKRLYIFISIIVLLSIIIWLVLPALNNNTGSGEMHAFKKEGELVFFNEEKEIKKIDIEIADTDYDRQLGLMYREKMTEDEGMLFIFPYEIIQSFWMRNTKISLDMIFVNSQKEIVTIHKNTTPYSEQSYASDQPSKYVVEVVAGFTDKFGIKVGDKVNWLETKINF
jgi:uncharacterized membrane protein (UPF0127 family)